MSTSPIKVLRIDDGAAEVLEVVPSLTVFQGLLNGGWLEAISGVKTLPDGSVCEWSAYCDEEGKIKGLAPNRLATAVAQSLNWGADDFLCGPVIFLGAPDDEGEDTSIPQPILDALTKQ